MGDILGGGKAAAAKANREQQAQIAKQETIEKARLATEEDAIARRKLAGSAGRAGRSSLIATSQTGTAGSLGGV
jgi:hypothetical protein